MLWLKSCRRCAGDMYLNKDYYGAFIQCIQCGFVMDVELKKGTEVSSQLNLTRMLQTQTHVIAS